MHHKINYLTQPCALPGDGAVGHDHVLPGGPGPAHVAVHRDGHGVRLHGANPLRPGLGLGDHNAALINFVAPARLYDEVNVHLAKSHGFQSSKGVAVRAMASICRFGYLGILRLKLRPVQHISGQGDASYCIKHR